MQLVKPEIVDKAFDTNDIRQRLARDKKSAVIPNQGRRCQQYAYDKHLYKERHLVENFFQRI